MYSIVNGRAIATAQVNDRKFGLRTLGWTAINWERVEKARNIYIKHELICVTVHSIVIFCEGNVGRFHHFTGFDASTQYMCVSMIQFFFLIHF